MSHLAAVAHYTGLAQQAAALNLAQTAHDNRAEPELDDDTLTPDEAEAVAIDELLTTTEPLADWIAKKCDCDQGRAPIDTTKLAAVDLIDCDRVPVLLAAIVNGTRDLERTAIDRLRDLYLRAERKALGQRTAELLGAQ